MRRIVYITLALTMMMAGSCIEAPEWTTDIPAELDDVRLRLRLNTPADFDSPEFAAPETRGMNYLAENTIDNIYVLVFDQNNNLFDIKPGEGTTNDPNTAQGTFTLTLPAGGTRRLLVLANAAATLAATIGTDNTSRYIGTPYNDVVAAISSAVTGPLYPGTPPTGRIHMWGETGQIPITMSNSSQTIQLMRGVSRIDVGVGQMTYNPTARTYSWDGRTAGGVAIPFRLNHVYLMRPNNRQAIVPAVASRDANGRVVAPTIPAGTTAYSVAESQALFGYTTPAGWSTQDIYTAEFNCMMGAGGTPGDANHVNRMALVVGGFYNNSTTETYYRIDFANNGVMMNVLRNNFYQFSIANIAGPGFPTVAEAYTSLAMNMAVSILVWNQADMGNIVFDGNSFFGIDRQEVHFTPNAGQSQTVNIRTNIQNFTMRIGETQHLQASPTPGTYTDPTTGFVYTLTNTGSQTYTLRVDCPNPNVSASGAARSNQWSIVANRLNLNFLADQQGSSNFTSVTNGQSTTLHPEGTNGNNIPLTVISRNPVTVTVAYTPQPGSSNWLTGIVTNPPPDGNGHYAANMSLSVPPYVYGVDGTSDRTATITITPQGETPTVYRIVQEVPYITLSPNAVTIPRPATPGVVNTPIKILTNIMPADLITPPGARSDNQGLTWLSAPGPYRRTDEPEARNQMFDIVANMNQAALDYTGSFSAGFTVTANPRYGNVTSAGTNSATATVNGSRDVFDMYWYKTGFQPRPDGTTPEWTAQPARYTDRTANYVFPWNTIRAEFDIDSNMAPVPDPSIPPATLITGAPTDRGNGITGYPYVYTLPVTTYANQTRYSLRFNSTNPAGQVRFLGFSRGIQHLTRNGPERGLSDYRGASGTDPNAALIIRSNVNWTASLAGWTPTTPAAGTEWVSMRIDASNFTSQPLTQDDCRYVPVATDSYDSANHLVAPNHTLFFSAAPINQLNPITGFNNSARTVNVNFTNNSYDATGGRRGADNPAPLQIVQFAPVLRSIANSLPPNGAHIPFQATPLSFTAATNMKGWGIRAYMGQHSTTNRPIVQAQYANPDQVNYADYAHNYTTNITVPPNNAESPRDIYFYLYCTEFSPDPGQQASIDNEILVSVRTQDYWVATTQAPGGTNNVLYYDPANRLRVGKFQDGAITGFWSSDGPSFSSNLIYFKFGGVIGFDGNGRNMGEFGVTGGDYGQGSLRFLPQQQSIGGYNDIPWYNSAGQDTTTPGYYISDPGYHNYDNVRVGKGDPCRLVGFQGPEIQRMTRDQFNAAMAASQWRIATANENAIFGGGIGATTFDERVVTQTWYTYYQWNGLGTRPTQFHYNWLVAPANGTMRGVWMPVSLTEQKSPDGVYMAGTPFRNNVGQLIVTNPVNVNYWSGTSRDGSTAYSIAQLDDTRFAPNNWRTMRDGLPVRCVRRNPGS
ncbi:MAG: FimB/Mfa2 family fimbrial subunit [Alistipes sp.]|nr:FimB/Mfa2 family fimbrial subunit [Alistipes sp.]